MGARGPLIGIAALSAVVFSAPMGSPLLFYMGAVGIGLGGGLFSVATLTAAMNLPERGLAGRGLVLGAWGAAQATAAGLAVAFGGFLRDGVDIWPCRAASARRCTPPPRATALSITSRSDCFS